MIETSDFDQLVQMPKSRQAQRPSSPRGLATLARYRPAADAAGRHLGDNRKCRILGCWPFPTQEGSGISPAAPPARNDARPNR